jgi:hypothetical protein
MGSSPKTLERLKHLTATGVLNPGASICDIGATQLFGDDDQQALRAFLSFYAGKSASARGPDDVPPETLRAIASLGFLGDLLILAGFKYTALDIFHATNTILFDLNIHEPGPRLIEQFDLVMNFGTTEHVFNQLRAFQTIHSLMKVGGVCYHDLPMAGYINHALYRYDPLFFSTVLPANDYETLFRTITLGAKEQVPEQLKQLGYVEETYTNVGIEIIYKRTSRAPFRVPLETTGSLSVDPGFEEIADSDLVRLPVNSSVHYGLQSASFGQLTKYWFSRLKQRVSRSIFTAAEWP